MESVGTGMSLSKKLDFCLPCPCQVGAGRKYTFQDIRNMFETASRSFGEPVIATTLAVSDLCEQSDHPPNIRWLVDLARAGGSSSPHSNLAESMLTFMHEVQGEIAFEGQDFLRVHVPVSGKERKILAGRNLNIPPT